MRIAFLGDPLTAAGFRLAGAEVHMPAEAGLARRFEELCDTAGLVILTSEIANRLPEELIDSARASVSPLILIVPAAPEAAAPRDQVGSGRSGGFQRSAATKPAQLSGEKSSAGPAGSFESRTASSPDQGPRRGRAVSTQLLAPVL